MNAKAAEAVWSNLQNYSDRQDRTDPAVFAGRDAEIKDLTACLAQIASPKNLAGATTIIQGVPGAGKTALANEYRKRMHGQVMTVQRPGEADLHKLVICIDINEHGLGKPSADLAGAMHVQLMHALAHDTSGLHKLDGFARNHLEQIGDLAARVFGRKTESESRSSKYELTEQSTLQKCLEAYGDVWGDDIAFVLLIDEAQNIPPNDKARQNLSVLHKRNHPCRILPVLLGLPDTADLVKRSAKEGGLGLSRLRRDGVSNIGCLNPAEGNEPSESRQVISGTLDALGLNWATPGWRDILQESGFDEHKWSEWRNQLVDQLEVDSADFPQHITAGLMATCDALLSQQHRLDLNQALRYDIAARQMENKDTYYKNRLDGTIEPYILAFGALCELEAEGYSIGEHEVMTALDICKGRSAIASHPKSPSTLTVLHTALSKGILQKYGKAYCFNETPSLSSHLRNQYQQDLDAADPTAEALREALEPDGGWTGGGGGPK